MRPIPCKVFLSLYQLTAAQRLQLEALFEVCLQCWLVNVKRLFRCLSLIGTAWFFKSSFSTLLLGRRDFRCGVDVNRLQQKKLKCLEVKNVTTAGLSCRDTLSKKQVRPLEFPSLDYWQLQAILLFKIMRPEYHYYLFQAGCPI